MNVFSKIVPSVVLACACGAAQGELMMQTLQIVPDESELTLDVLLFDEVIASPMSRLDGTIEFSYDLDAGTAGISVVDAVLLDETSSLITLLDATLTAPAESIDVDVTATGPLANPLMPTLPDGFLFNQSGLDYELAGILTLTGPAPDNSEVPIDLAGSSPITDQSILDALLQVDGGTTRLTLPIELRVLIDIPDENGETVLTLPVDVSGSIVAVVPEPTAATADIVMQLSADNEFVDPQQRLTYQIVVGNAGPENAIDVLVESLVPDGLANATWTCTASNANCGTANATADVIDQVDINVGGSVTYTLTATVDATEGAILVSAATAMPPVDLFDPNTENNEAQITVQVALFNNGFETD